MNRGLLSLALLSVFGAYASAADTEYVAREVLVRFNDAATSMRPLYHQGIGAHVIDSVPALRLQRVRIPVGMSVKQAVDYYRSLSAVKYAEPNLIDHLHATTNDPRLSEQYAVPHMKVNQAWDLTFGSDAVVVGVVDSGCDYNHPDLVGKIIKGPDTANGDDDPMDDNGHGTHTSGTIAANTNNGIGVAGIGYNTKVYAVKAATAAGGLSIDAIVKGVTAAADFGCDIISMSFGGYGESQARKDAIDYAFGKGCVLFASAGNDNVDLQSYPAAYPNVIAVGSTDDRDQKSDFSNFGSWVDIAAPGTDVLSTVPNNGYEKFSGTSMACPDAAGVAALLIAYGGKGSVTNVEIRDAIESTTTFVGPWLTHGLVNAELAIQRVRPPVVENVLPTEVKKYQGSTTSGSVADLNGNDGLFYTVNSKLISGVGTVAGPIITYPFNYKPTRYLSAQFTVRSIGVTGATATAYIRRKDGTFDPLKSWGLKNTKVTTNVDLPADIAPYVQAKKIKLVVRAVWPTRLGNNQSFSYKVDQATVRLVTKSPLTP